MALDRKQKRPSRLTDTFIQKLTSPEQNHRLYFDARVPGRALRVPHNGLKSWILQYYSPTKRKQYRWTFVDSKDFAKWPLETVMKQAQGFREQLAEGIDPAEAAAEAANPTVEAEPDRKDGKLTVADLSKKYMQHAESRPDAKRPSSMRTTARCSTT